jgi:hypothetical protein
MRKDLILFLITAITISGCWDWQRRPRNESYKKVWGYKPVYSSDSNLLKVQAEQPRVMKNPGKIYVKGNLVFQNDIGYGIHVIDKTNPSQPQPASFIRVWGSSEISIQGNFLYTNSYSSLIVVDISDWQQVRELKRIPNAFTQGSQGGQPGNIFIPLPQRGVYYDCFSVYNTSDRIQTGWEMDSIYNNCLYR